MVKPINVPVLTCWVDVENILFKIVTKDMSLDPGEETMMKARLAKVVAVLAAFAATALADIPTGILGWPRCC